jgi:peptidoglycan/LPS O-acetylase OafA/YrhL
MDAFLIYKSRRYFGSLDGLRALSILAVVWHHAQPDVEGSPLSRLGFLGVDMFFVLSGFLIVTLLLRERERAGDISLGGFYLRRSLRIFPLYYGLLAALTLVYTIKPGGNTAAGFFRDLPYLLIYLTDWIHPLSIMGIAWSLAVEEQFYLLWPPIEKWLSRWAWPILLAILVVNQAINFLVAAGLLSKWLTPWRVPLVCHITFTPICLGVALAHVLNSPRGFRILARFISAPWSPAAILGALILDCWVCGPNDLSGWPRLSIQLLMTVLLASCAMRDRHWLGPVLDSPWMRRIGVVSYGIYLYHLIAIHLAREVLARGHLSFPQDTFWMGFFISWGLAELSYRFYETPFLKLKETLSRRHASAAATRPRSGLDEPIGEVATTDRPSIQAELGDGSAPMRPRPAPSPAR